MATADDGPIVVVGAGLAGAITALFFARRGWKVVLMERRSDLRKSQEVETSEKGTYGLSKDAVRRSINLALSHRGQAALRRVGLYDKVMAQTIPMPTRAIHSKEGKIALQPYGTNGQAIYSVSRVLINCILLDTVEAVDNVTLMFGCKVKGVDKSGIITYQQAGETKTIAARLVVGADGAYSSVRDSLLRMSRTNFSRFYIDHGYKELSIPASDSGDFRLPTPHALHIWPRHEFMLIALPNSDRSFTCTMFAPFKTFEELSTQSDAEIQQFFETNFPDAYPLIPDLVSQFHENPTGPLVTISLSSWNLKDRIVLLGDAAHAVVPFYGQGMNAAFEDALFLDEMLERCGGDLTKAIPRFSEERQPAGQGISTLSLRNYYEMRSATASRLFRFQKVVEKWLHRWFPSLWVPQYTMVAFTRIPYHEALAKADKQEAILKRTIQVVGAIALAGAAYGVSKAVDWKAVAKTVGKAALEVKGWLPGGASTKGDVAKSAAKSAAQSATPRY